MVSSGTRELACSRHDNRVLRAGTLRNKLRDRIARKVSRIAPETCQALSDPLQMDEKCTSGSISNLGLSTKGSKVLCSRSCPDPR
jgi:hypothetical protein